MRSHYWVKAAFREYLSLTNEKTVPAPKMIDAATVIVKSEVDPLSCTLWACIDASASTLNKAHVKNTRSIKVCTTIAGIVESDR
jgi:hypothetical protein